MLLSICLEPRDAQTLDAEMAESLLPAEVFFDRPRIRRQTSSRASRPLLIATTTCAFRIVVQRHVFCEGKSPQSSGLSTALVAEAHCERSPLFKMQFVARMKTDPKLETIKKAKSGGTARAVVGAVSDRATGEIIAEHGLDERFGTIFLDGCKCIRA